MIERFFYISHRSSCSNNLFYGLMISNEFVFMCAGVRERRARDKQRKGAEDAVCMSV